MLPNEARSKQILLVEDDSAIMETLVMFLQYEGYDVVKARSVERALQILAECRPDLVLLDYMLQDDTAEPVVNAVRARYGGDVRVLLLTAAEDPDGKSRTIGTDGVVAKPFELDSLLRSVRKSLEGDDFTDSLSSPIGTTAPRLKARTSVGATAGPGL